MTEPADFHRDLDEHLPAPVSPWVPGIAATLKRVMDAFDEAKLNEGSSEAEMLALAEKVSRLLGVGRS